MQQLYKNVASQVVAVYAYSKTTGNPALAIDGDLPAFICKDNGGNSLLTNSTPTELGEGVYIYTLTQAETNADHIIITPSVALPDIACAPVIMTTRVQVPDVNVAQISGDAVAANNAELFFDNTGFAATNSSIGSVGSSTGIVNAIMASTGIDGYTLEQALRVLLAFVGGRCSGVTGGSGTITFRSINNANDRIVMGVDIWGNRTTVTLNPSGTGGYGA